MGQKIIYESTDPRFLSDLQHPDPLSRGMTTQHSASNILICKRFHIWVRNSEHCLVEKLKQNLEPREYLALLLLAHQRKYQSWTSLFSAQVWQTNLGKGRSISLFYLLPHSEQEHTVLGELEGHAGCCACSFTWWETTDPSAAGLSSRPWRANVR